MQIKSSCVLDSNYIWRQSAWSCDILHIIAAIAARVSLLRVSMPSLSFPTLPRDPLPHFRNTCLLSDICHYNPLFSQQQQAAGGKSLSCDNFSTPVVVSCPVGSDPAERKQQPSTVTVCSGV